MLSPSASRPLLQAGAAAPAAFAGALGILSTLCSHHARTGHPTAGPPRAHVPITLCHGTRGFGALRVERSCWQCAGTSSWLWGEQLPHTCQNSPSAAPHGQAARGGCQRAGEGTCARTRPPKYAAYIIPQPVGVRGM